MPVTSGVMLSEGPFSQLPHTASATRPGANELLRDADSDLQIAAQLREGRWLCRKSGMPHFMALNNEEHGFL